MKLAAIYVFETTICVGVGLFLIGYTGWLVAGKLVR